MVFSITPRVEVHGSKFQDKIVPDKNVSTPKNFISCR